MVPLASMTNILSDDNRQQVLALGRLGWTLRRIEQATGVRRETASAYLKAAGLAVRSPGRWGHPAANPAIEVSTDPGARLPGLATPPPGRAPAASACEPYRELIALALARGRDAMAIWQPRQAGSDRPLLARHTESGLASLRRVPVPGRTGVADDVSH